MGEKRMEVGMKRVGWLGVLGVVVWLLSAASVNAGIIYVDDDAGAGGDGASWGTAYNCLQDALEDANSRPKPVDVWVAKGVYKPAREVGGGGDIYKTFQMINGVAIYGGFAGNETEAFDINHRNFSSNETVLSGDLLGNDTPGLEPADMYLDPNRWDNCLHVFFHPEGTGLDSSAALDGFTITGGHAVVLGTSHADAGGGMFNRGNSPTVSNCRFAGNCGYNGGGMLNAASGSPSATNCTFVNNVGFFGGGMHNEFSSPVITRCTFEHNLATMFGGGVLNRNCSTATITGCVFRGNKADQGGGGMCDTLSSRATVRNCTFSGNAAQEGGGMHNIEGFPILINCIFWGNIAEESNEIKNGGSKPTISYSNIAGSGGSSNWDPNLGTDGGGNIDAGPCFVDANGFDGIAGTEDDNLRLRAGSPCIDAGDNGAVTEANDLQGRARIFDGDEDGTATVDMGAYEYGPVTIYVKADGTGEYPTIQAAVNAAVDGDEVELQAGVYSGEGNRDINFLGKAITVRSSCPDDPCVIGQTIIERGAVPDGNNHWGFHLEAGEDTDSVVAGLTIRGFIGTGAGVAVSNACPTIEKCRIHGNGQGIMAQYSSEAGQPGVIRGCVIEENVTGIMLWTDTDILVEDCTISDGDTGIAVEANGVLLTLTGCRISGHRGYPMYLPDWRMQIKAEGCSIIGNRWGIIAEGPLDMSNCIIAGNYCAWGESAIEGGESYGPGEILHCGCLKMGHCTVVDNYVEGGSVLRAEGGVIIENCVLRSQGNDNAVRVGPTSINEIAYSNIAGGQAGVRVDGSVALRWGLGNIDVDPCFVETGYWGDVNDANIAVEPNDANAVWVGGDYHLKSEGWRWDVGRGVWTWDEVTSRCIDAGCPGMGLGDEVVTLDVDPDNEFGVNKRINMGAYGGTGAASMGPEGWSLLGDLTNDGIVNGCDYSAMVMEENGSGVNCGDMNRDGAVDMFDIAELAAQWLAETTWH